MATGEEGATKMKKPTRPPHRKGKVKKDRSESADTTSAADVSGDGKGIVTKPSHKKRQQQQKGLTSSKPQRAPRPAQKTYYKVIIRRLPATEFNKEQFIETLEKVFSCLDERFKLNGTTVRLLHYIEGKISRARGNISSTAYLSFDDVELKNKFLAMVPAKVHCSLSDLSLFGYFYTRIYAAE